MIEIITSFNKNYYDMIGKDCVESFITHWDTSLSLTCYVENFRLPEQDRIKQIDFSELNPDYKWFQQDINLSNSVKKFSKKAYSFIHAMEHSHSKWIVWIDADVVTIKNLPLHHILDILKPGHLSMYMGVTYTEDKAGVPGNWLVPETGLFAVNTGHRRFTEFKNEYCRRYFERDNSGLRRFYDNDVFGAALNLVPTARVVDLSKKFSKPYKTPLPHTVLGEYLKHYKAKHSKAEYNQAAPAQWDSDLGLIKSLE